MGIVICVHEEASRKIGMNRNSFFMTNLDYWIRLKFSGCMCRNFGRANFIVCKYMLIFVKSKGSVVYLIYFNIYEAEVLGAVVGDLKNSLWSDRP